MPAKMRRMVVVALMALVCAFAPVISAVSLQPVSQEITRLGIYDGGGSGG